MITTRICVLGYAWGKDEILQDLCLDWETWQGDTPTVNNITKQYDNILLLVLLNSNNRKCFSISQYLMGCIIISFAWHLGLNVE